MSLLRCLYSVVLFVVGVASVVTLVIKGLDWHVDPESYVMAAIINWDKSLNEFLWFLDPRIREVLDYVAVYFGIQLSLNADWKHIAILAWIYAKTDANTTKSYGMRMVGFTLASWGLLASIATGLAAGINWTSTVEIWAKIAGTELFLLGLWTYLTGATLINGLLNPEQYGREELKELPPVKRMFEFWASTQKGEDEKELQPRALRHLIMLAVGTGLNVLFWFVVVPGLMPTASSVIAGAFMLVCLGLYWGGRGIKQWIANKKVPPNIHIALGILQAFLGAATIFCLYAAGWLP